METKGDSFRFVMVLKINGNSLLKVINTVFNEGILRIISYYDSDYYTASLKEKRVHISYLRIQMVRTECRSASLHSDAVRVAHCLDSAHS